MGAAARRPYRLRSQVHKVDFELGRREKPFIFYSEQAVQNGLPSLPIAISDNTGNENKFTMLSPQTLLEFILNLIIFPG